MPSIELGFVTIHPETILPKAKWKLGKVEKLMVGADGNVRSAVVRVGNSKGSSSCFQRPIQKPFPYALSKEFC